jgi:putative transposase
VLLRLAYLGVTNAFALLRLLPMSSRDKDAEILAHRLHLVVRPDNVLRWHRDVIARRHARRSRPRRPGRPRTVRSIRVLVLRLVRENPGWGIAGCTATCWCSA